MTAAAPVRELSDTFRIVALVEEVVQAMERDQTFASTLAASGAAWHLMALLCAERTAGAPRVSAIDQAIEYLRQHVTDQISIADLARMARLSPSHFAARFRQETGSSPLKYQTQLRMARARELLDTTDLPVAQIAARVGYADPFYFARQFTSVHGMPPIRYRREGRAEGQRAPVKRALHSSCRATSSHIGCCGAAFEQTIEPRAPTRRDSRIASRQYSAPIGPSSKRPSSGV